MVREFYLMNEKNEKYSLMDIENYCLLTDPSGLGYEYDTEYEKLGNLFVESIRTLTQGRIGGTANFKSYENFRDFVNFVEAAKKLKISYKIPIENELVEYFRDVKMKSLSKTQKLPNGCISESVLVDCLSLWYQDEKTIYDINEQDIIWDFYWDPYFADYDVRSVVVNNDGHVDAPFQIEIPDYLKNPVIEILVDGKVINRLALEIEIQNGQKFQYSSKEGEIYLRVQNSNGTYTSLFTNDYVDINNENIFQLPQGNEVEIRMSAENNIMDGTVNVFKRYKVV